MKFIHTGDVHWGMCPDADKPWGRERAQAIKDTFRLSGDIELICKVFVNITHICVHQHTLYF